MKKLSKLAIFFIVCGGVFLLGLICAIGGAASGGVDGFEKVADDFDWVQGSPGERGVTAYPVEDFDSVYLTGDADYVLVGRGAYKNASKLVSDGPLEPTELDLVQKNQVLVIAGDRVQQPEIVVKDGALSIGCDRQEVNGINFNSSEMSWTPTILVCCPKAPLEELTVSSQEADLTCLGTAWKKADIGINYGDVEMDGVKSAGLQMELDYTDAELDGEFLKTTAITATDGDVDIATPLAKTEYGLDLRAVDIQLTTPEGVWNPEAEEMDGEYDDGYDDEYDDGTQTIKVNGGPNRMSVSAECGDLKIQFGGSAGN